MNSSKLRQNVLDWYEKNGRELPWRYKNGETPEPYRVWLSEIMLQQTTVTAVKPYFERFTTKYPTIQSLAKANRDDIMNLWAGLGYYSRARNLHACAQTVVEEYKGVFPQTQKELKMLSGIGDYTSAAILTIAFNKPATVMDGNIERITARIFDIHDPLPKSKPIIKHAALGLFEKNNKDNRHGDFAQALMDIGAKICTPKSPKCLMCPINRHCIAHKKGTAKKLPVKQKKAKTPYKQGYVFLIKNPNGDIVIHKRPDKGLLAGMNGLPTTKWETSRPENTPPFKIAQNHIKTKTQTNQIINHVFTHFKLTLTRIEIHLNKSINLPETLYWYPEKKVKEAGMPTVFTKCLDLAFETHHENR